MRVAATIFLALLDVIAELNFWRISRSDVVSRAPHHRTKFFGFAALYGLGRSALPATWRRRTTTALRVRR